MTMNENDKQAEPVGSCGHESCDCRGYCQKLQANPAEPVACLTSHPIQPLKADEEGVVRFKENSIVSFLTEGKLNELAVMDFPREDWVQLAQLIGYSLSGWGTLSYVSDEDWERANQNHPAQPVQPAGAEDLAVYKKIADSYSHKSPSVAINEQLLEALKTTGLFLHHCWCDVQMNDYSFEKLGKQMEIVDAAIAAAEAAKKGGV